MHITETDQKSVKKPVLYLAVSFGILALLMLGYYLKVRAVPPVAGDFRKAIISSAGTDHFTSENGSWLKKNDHGVWEMRLIGGPYERGEHFGTLAKNLVSAKEDAFVGEIKNRVPSPGYLRFLKYMVGWFNRDIDDYVPEEYLLEIAASAKYMPDKYDYIAQKYQRALSYHAAHDIGHALQNMNLVGCTSFAVWGEKSENRSLLIGRNFDFYFGQEFAKDQIIAFYKPDDGYQFMSVTWACFTGVVSGMNERGLSITLNSAKSEIPGKGKTPVSLLARQILQYSGTIDEAFALAKSYETFVAETFLIGSKADGKVALIEKTPDATAIYFQENDMLIATNHLQSKALKDSPLNKEYEAEGVSQYRYARVQQLIDSLKPMNAEKTALLLRDKKGMDGIDIGLGNEKAINQLVAHHSIIFSPEEMMVWVSSPPYQLGNYLAYDLNDIFSGTREFTYSDTASISEDPFLMTSEFKDFERFTSTKEEIQKYLYGSRSEAISETELSTFIDENPNSFLGYYYLGDYRLKQENYEHAATLFSDGLTKEIARESERSHMEKGLAEALQNLK